MAKYMDINKNFFYIKKRPSLNRGPPHLYFVTTYFVVYFNTATPELAVLRRANCPKMLAAIVNSGP